MRFLQMNFLVVVGWMLLLAERLIGMFHTAISLDAPLGTNEDERSSRRDYYRNKLIPLDELAQSKKISTCVTGLIPVRDITSGDATKGASEKRRIPLVIHQTSKTRCLAPELTNLVNQWQNLKGFDYYFHDDDAVDYLLQQDYPEFPTLKSVIGCIMSPTLKADLWRYLVLWDYGGIYVDLDSLPNEFYSENDSSVTIDPDDQGFFVVDHYHYLSQYFIAVSPRHVLMYYTIQAALSNILLARDTGNINPARTTGPTALHSGLKSFCRDGGVDLPTALTNSQNQKQLGPVSEGVYSGGSGSSIRVVGKEDNQVVHREGLGRGEKNLVYHKMGMQHYSKTRHSTNTSCLVLLYQEANGINAK